MKTMPSAHQLQRQAFLEWYHAAGLGQTLQSLESSYLKLTLELTYNRKTLQVGWLGTERCYMDQDFLGDFVVAGGEGSHRHTPFVAADADALPFATESIDTLILPHVLEFEPDRHQVLREAERVLKPEGRLLVLGLNPWCPRRLLQLHCRSSFWNARLMPSHQLLDWLSLLKFDAERDAAFGHSKPAARMTETPWARLQSGLAMAYGIKAVKRSYTLIPVEPDWIRMPQMVSGRLLDTPQFSKHPNHD